MSADKLRLSSLPEGNQISICLVARHTICTRKCTSADPDHSGGCGGFQHRVDPQPCKQDSKDNTAPLATISRSAHCAHASTRGPFFLTRVDTHIWLTCQLKAQDVSHYVYNITHRIQPSMALLDQILAQALPAQPALQFHMPQTQFRPLELTTPASFANVEMIGRMTEQSPLTDYEPNEIKNTRNYSANSSWRASVLSSQQQVLHSLSTRILRHLIRNGSHRCFRRTVRQEEKVKEKMSPVQLLPPWVSSLPGPASGRPLRSGRSAGESWEKSSRRDPSGSRVALHRLQAVNNFWETSGSGGRRGTVQGAHQVLGGVSSQEGALWRQVALHDLRRAASRHPPRRREPHLHSRCRRDPHRLMRLRN